MKKTIIILGILLNSMTLLAQVAPYKYFVAFKDKAGSPYSVTRPQEFLSERAIERRSRQGIAVIQEDIPVNMSYITAISGLGGKVLTVSKWFNGITIYLSDTTLITQIEALPFVAGVVKSAGAEVPGGASNEKIRIEQESIKSLNFSGIPSQPVTSKGYNYGASYNQIHMVKGDLLHDMGYRGEGKIIAILDGGFYMANSLPAFDSLRVHNQILGTRDFVNPGNDVYNESPHGMEVLSIMGGMIPGLLIGTAPKAEYWLLRSEDVDSEYLVEEYNWVSAAEFADSVGADIINSSLGYTTFNDPRMNHTCADMNGHTTPVTIGANTAASKGLIVVNSAGNSGGTSWKCVGAPSDGYGVLSIAAVDSLGLYAAFSSTGSLVDRVKPNVAAQGRATVLSAPDGSIGWGNGTSFSSPVIAGMVACLWQAIPNATYHEVFRAIEISASQATNPDSLLGYGIPDFALALMKAGEEQRIAVEPEVTLFPVPFTDHLTICLSECSEREVSVSIYSILGHRLHHSQHVINAKESPCIHLNKLESLSHGCYMVKITGRDFTIVNTIVK